jgi:hypothetical protein
METSVIQLNSMENNEFYADHYTVMQLPNYCNIRHSYLSVEHHGILKYIFWAQRKRNEKHNIILVLVRK